MIKPKVLFLCTANGCRTQMAEAFLREMAGDRFDVTSAGLEQAAEISAYALDAMREVGIDMSSQYPKKADRFLGERFSYVVTLCDREKEPACPIFPGALWRLSWPVDDPLSENSPERRRTAVRRARDEIRERVVEFVQKA